MNQYGSDPHVKANWDSMQTNLRCCGGIQMMMMMMMMTMIMMMMVPPVFPFIGYDDDGDDV